CESRCRFWAVDVSARRHRFPRRRPQFPSNRRRLATYPRLDAKFSIYPYDLKDVPLWARKLLRGRGPFSSALLNQHTREQQMKSFTFPAALFAAALGITAHASTALPRSTSALGTNLGM